MSNDVTLSGKYRVCTDREDRLSFELSFCTHLCRYHRLPKRVNFDNRLLTPWNMCIDLFHAAYPYALAMLYGAQFKHPVEVSCPYAPANIRVKLETKATLTKPVRRLIAYILARAGRKTEIPDTRLTLTILSDANSNCPYAYAQGTQFQFNIWQGREVCPALFDALYPSVHNLMRAGCIPWHQGVENNAIVCPDYKSNITLALTNTRDDGRN